MQTEDHHANHVLRYSLKFKRPKVVKAYRELLDELYATCPPEQVNAKL